MKHNTRRLAFFFFLAVLALSGGISRNARAETSSILTKDGSTVYFDDIGPKEKTPLVFIHCWSCDRKYWKEQADFSKNYRMILIDLPGHGESTVGKKLKPTVQALAKDVSEVIKKLNLRDAILVGSSMGGPISLEVARLNPQQIKGVIGVDNLHNVETSYPKVFFDQLADRLEKDFEDSIKVLVKHLFPKKSKKDVVKWVAQEASQACEKEFCVPLFRAFPDIPFSSLMTNAGVPVRNINAVPYSPDAPKTDVATNQKYGDFDAIEMKGVGHFPMLEKPSEFNENLKKQIAAIQRAGRASKKKS